MSIELSGSRCWDSSSRRCAGGSSPWSPTPRTGRKGPRCRSWNSCRRNLVIDQLLTTARSNLPSLTTSNLESTSVGVKGILGEIHLTGYFNGDPGIKNSSSRVFPLSKCLLHIVFDDFLVCDSQSRHLPQYFVSLKVLQTINFQVRLPQTFDCLKIFFQFFI